MSGSESPSTGAARQAPDIASIFSSSDQAPKPLSDFPQATWDMYSAYIQLWHGRNEKFNTFAAKNRFYHKLTLNEDEGGPQDRFFEFLAQTVSEAKETLMVDLGKLDQRFEAWCDGSGDGYIGDIEGFSDLEGFSGTEDVDYIED